MVRPNYRDSIYQVVNDINRNPSLEELNETSMKQGVVLRVLDAAGWSAFDLSEVEPEYRTGNTKVDFALKGAQSSRMRSAAMPKVLVEVKSLEDNLDSERHHRKLLGNCAKAEVELGVLTNGLAWMMFLWSAEADRQDSRFCRVDIRQDPDTAVEEINKYLAKDKVSNGQAVRSAERALRDRNQGEVMRSAIVEGWQQVVAGMDEGLVELIATAAEVKTGMRPENRLVRRVLVDERAELLASAVEGTSSAGMGGGGRSRPASFTFESESTEVRSWPELLIGFCEIIRSKHPQEFEKILDIRGRSIPYFSRNEEEVHLPRQIGETGIYASCQGAGDLIERRARRVLSVFGYPDSSLVIERR